MLTGNVVLSVLWSSLIVSQLSVEVSAQPNNFFSSQRVANQLKDATCRAYRTAVTARYLYDTMTPRKSSSTGQRTSPAKDYLSLVDKSYAKEYVLLPQPMLRSDSLDNIKKMTSIPLIHRFAFYAAVSYCNDQETAQNLKDVRLGDDASTPLPVTGYKITHWYNHKSVAHYVAVNPQQRMVVLTFRGSSNLQNYIDAVDSAWIHPDPTLFSIPKDAPSDIPLMPEEARQFRGYNRAAEKQIKIAIAELVKAHKAYPYYAVVINGHSLGGTIAQLAATYARLHYRKSLRLAAVYTFGEPIFSNGIFADWSVDVIKPTPVLRFTAKDDVVPILWHEDDASQPEKKRMRHGKDSIEIHCPDPKNPAAFLCQGHNDQDCSVGQDCRVASWENHVDYAGMRISGRFCKLGQK
ncbi:Alpha/Beta hydrolase protein [Syncephalis fuscata]|nr:Alpha/Beta hydrolase protein [Syncephalis fuscata]